MGETEGTTGENRPDSSMGTLYRNIGSQRSTICNEVILGNWLNEILIEE